MISRLLLPAAISWMLGRCTRSSEHCHKHAVVVQQQDAKCMFSFWCLTRQSARFVLNACPEEADNIAAEHEMAVRAVVAEGVQPLWVVRHCNVSA